MLGHDGLEVCGSRAVSQDFVDSECRRTHWKTLQRSSIVIEQPRHPCVLAPVLSP